MTNQPDLSHRLRHRGVYKYVLTKNVNDQWRVSIINGTPEEKDPKAVLAVLQEALTDCQKLIDQQTT